MPDRHAIRNGKLARVRQVFGDGKVIPMERTVELLETVIQPGDRIIHEGDNQKQGDFLAGQLARMNPQKVHDLKLCVSSVGLPEYGRVEELTPDALNAACWLHPTQYSNVAEHLLLGTLTRTLRDIRVWLWGPSPGNRLASWTPF